AVVFVGGCAGRAETTRGPAVERSGSLGSLQYRLRSQISPARVTLGDRAVWRLTAELSGAEAQPGAFSHGPADSSLEIVPLEPPSASRRESGARWSTALEVRGYDIGRMPHPIAWITATVAGTVDTLDFPPDTLYVDSLTAAITGSVEPDEGRSRPSFVRPTTRWRSRARCSRSRRSWSRCGYTGGRGAAPRSPRASGIGRSPQPPRRLGRRASHAIRRALGSTDVAAVGPRGALLGSAPGMEDTRASGSGAPGAPPARRDACPSGARGRVASSSRHISLPDRG